MEVDPTRVCELLVGLGDVEVLGVDGAVHHFGSNRRWWLVLYGSGLLRERHRVQLHGPNLSVHHPLRL